MRDAKWIRDLQPDEAGAALAALDAQPPPDTVRGILEMRAMREALMVKVKDGSGSARCSVCVDFAKKSWPLVQRQQSAECGSARVSWVSL
jgi:hypothetical protein